MSARARWMSGVWLLLVAVVLFVVATQRSPARSSAASELSHAVSPAVAAAAHPPPTRSITLGPGSWCWFADPRSVEVSSPRQEIFVGWISWSGKIVVGEYDPIAGTRHTHVVGALFHDDHGSPSILAEPDKRITVFFSAHNGSRLYYRTTLRPEDISAWGPVHHVRSRLRGEYGFTYPNPITLPSEQDKLYLFWRGATWSADYATRTADGRWSPARVLIATPGQRPYLKVASNDSNEIGLAFTNGHPRNLVTSVFYAAYRAGALWRARGRRIARMPGPSIRPGQADVVYDGDKTGVSSWVWDVGFDPSQRPVILYATFPFTDNHAYWYAHFNGRRWVSHFMTNAGPSISPDGIEYEYSGGMALDHSDPSVVYLSRKVRGWFEIERWVTHDGGFTWSHRTVVRTPGTDDVRPVVTRGADGGPMTLLWLHGHYGDYTNYRTWISSRT